MIVAKNNINRIIIGFIIIICICVMGLFKLQTTLAEEKIKAVSMFTTTDNLSIKANQKAKTETSRSSVMLETSQSGAKAEVTDLLSGDFNSLLKVCAITDGIKTVNKFKIIVKTQTGEEIFSYVFISMNEDWTVAFLEKEGEKVSDEIGLKSSFDNSDNNDISASFNIAKNEISVNGQLFARSGKISLEHKTYKVYIEFSELSGQSQIIIYSLMGQSLSGRTLTNDAAPSLYVENITSHAMTGKEYALPYAVAYDIIDKNEVELSATLLLPNNDIISLNSDKFTPALSGKYTLIYETVDKEGKKFYCNVEFFAYDGQFINDNSTIALVRRLPETIEIGVGSTINFPAARVLNNYLQDGIVYPELIIENTKFKADEDTAYTFKNIGNIDVKYIYSVDGLEDVEKTIEVTVKDMPKIQAEDIKSRYSRGETIIFPELTAEKQGKSYTGQLTLYLPDGNTVNGHTLFADIIGEYKAEYQYNFDGTSYTYEQYFEVSMDFDYLIRNTKFLEYSINQSSPYYAKKANGIKISALRNGAGFTYASVIDLSNSTKTGAPLIEFNLAPKTYSFRDISAIELTLTDADDSSNYIRILLKDESTPGYYWLCNAYAGSGTNTLYGSFWGTINPSTLKGSQPTLSFRGEKNDKTYLDVSKIWLDYEEKAIYANYNGSTIIILDLDNPLHVGAGNEWFGFKNDRAVLSFKFSGAGDMLLYSVSGQSLSGDVLTDTVNDLKFLFDEGIEDQTPKGIKNQKYPIPSATLYSSVYGHFYNYSVNVYKNYGKSDEREIDITGNAFIPDDTGFYSIVYGVVTSRGIISKAITVEILDGIPVPELAFNEQDEAFFEQIIYLGQSVILPRAIAAVSTGTAEVIVTYLDGQTEVILTGYEFTPKAQKDYTINYTVKDYLDRTKTVSKTVVVKAKEKSVFIDDIDFNNQILMDGAKYILPQLKAYKYNPDGEKTEVDTAISVIYKGQTKTLGADRQFIPSVDTNKDVVTVVYSPTDGGTPKQYEFTILQPESFEDFFYGKNLTATKAQNHITFSSSSDTTMSFVNVLPEYYFNAAFNIPSASNGLNEITLYLKDSINSGQTIRFSMRKDQSGNTDILLNGKYIRNEQVAFFDNLQNIKYDSFNKTITNNAGKVLTNITHFENGESFNGFGSRKILLTIGFKGEDTRVIEISNLCGQSITSDYNDYVDPAFKFDFQKEADINTEYRIPVPVAVDVVDPNIDVYLTVTVNGKTLLNNVNALTAVHSIDLSEYGKYYFIFKVQDKFGNGSASPKTFTLDVRDKIAPVLEISGSVPLTGKLNGTIRLPKAAATDNHDGQLQAQIFVIAPDGMVTYIEGTSFIAKSRGRYFVMYYVEDKSCNYSLTKFEIIIV